MAAVLGCWPRERPHFATGGLLGFSESGRSQAQPPSCSTKPVWNPHHAHTPSLYLPVLLLLFLCFSLDTHAHAHIHTHIHIEPTQP